MRKWSIRWRPVCLVVLVILMAASFLAGAGSRDKPIHAQELTAPTPAGGPLPCTITEIYVTEGRIHVQCTPGVDIITYFAYPSASGAESRQANRYLVMLNTAYAFGKPVTLWYDDDASANPAGCQTWDCRRITGMVIQP